MYVCICNAVSEADIRHQVAAGVTTFAALQEQTGCSTCCGCCEGEARDLLAEALEERTAPRRRHAFALPVVARTAAA